MNTSYSAPNPPTRMRDLVTQAKEQNLLRLRQLQYILLALGLCALLTFAIIAFILIGDSWWQTVTAVCSAFLLVHFAFLVHDGAHFQIFRTPAHNEVFAVVTAALIVGASYSWWQHKHSEHHRNPNHMTLDPDVKLPIIHAKPQSTGFRSWRLIRLFSTHQGVLLFALMLLEGVSIYVASWKHLLRPGTVKYRALQITLIAINHSAVAILMIWILSPAIAGAILGIHLGLFGSYLGMVFALNHKGMPLITDTRKGDYLLRQVLVSRNIRSNALLAWLMGGLNNQIEHHLFPTAPRFTLRKLAVLVEQHCHRVGVPYNIVSLTESYRRVYQYVNRVGIGQSNDYICPLGTFQYSPQVIQTTAPKADTT
ncbi:fatty acid desaturase family protein [Glutamicibacter sp. NPDC087344]|uniref:fatty acid desaturase family protein n=1 Tax=Glutamicibacter sp. NPDC087344 TaxID=3363994 RepID=UPI00382275AC